MDSAAFDSLARAVHQFWPRRALAPLLGGLLATAEFSTRLAEAKKKKKKKITLCLDGQTIQASKKKKKKLLKSGATTGACSSPPPPPPTSCTPTCAGKPCGADDGCGNACSCPAGSLCDEGVCQTCTITCNDGGAACGAALVSALDAGGTIYACPGRYVGNFLVKKGTTLVGAGQGSDPASNTILDANESDGVMIIEPDITVGLRSLRITGGKDPSGGGGGGLFNTGVTTITGCTIAKNSAGAGDGGGIYNNGSGPLTLNACTISENSATGNGGGIRHFGSNSVTLNNCLVSRNQSDAAGAGIATASGAITINATEISGNVCQNSGGGVNVSGGTVTFDGASRIVNNTSVNGIGGGIRRALTGTVNLNEVAMSGNEPENCDDVPGCVNV